MTDAVAVIPVHNADTYTKNLLEYLQEKERRLPVVIVDDCSDSGLSKYLTEYVMARMTSNQDVFLLRNERQQLFTRTVNRGWRAAVKLLDPQYLITINTDCTLKPSWLQHLLAPFKMGASVSEKVGIVGFPQKYKAAHCYTTIQKPKYITGHCFAVRVNMLYETGVLCETDLDGRVDPVLKPYWGQAHIGSDRLLSCRANDTGWQTVECHYPLCDHAEGKSWHHNLQWLSSHKLDLLWEPEDSLKEPVWR